MEKNADERSKAARQDLETKLANLPNSLASQELEQAELKKGVDEERQLPKQPETDADELPVPISIRRTASDGPGMSSTESRVIVQKPIVQVESPSIQNGTYIIKNRARDVYWFASNLGDLHFLNPTTKNYDTRCHKRVSEHSSPII